MSEIHPETVPDFDIADLDARGLFLVLSARTFDLTTEDDTRLHVLGSLLGLVEEDRLLAAQERNQDRLDRLQQHGFEQGWDQEEEDVVAEPEPSEGSTVTASLVLVQQSPEGDDFDEEDGENT